MGGTSYNFNSAIITFDSDFVGLKYSVTFLRTESLFGVFVPVSIILFGDVLSANFTLLNTFWMFCDFWSRDSFMRAFHRAVFPFVVVLPAFSRVERNISSADLAFS